MYDFRVERLLLDEYDCEVDDLDGALGRCPAFLSGDAVLVGYVGELVGSSVLLIMSFRTILVVGVGTGLLNVTFFPPSPDALTVRVLSSYPSIISATSVNGLCREGPAVPVPYS